MVGIEHASPEIQELISVGRTIVRRDQDWLPLGHGMGEGRRLAQCIVN